MPHSVDPKSLASAVEISGTEPSIIGVRYEQPGLVGEFRLRSSETAAEGLRKLTERFTRDYETTPQIVAVAMEGTEVGRDSLSEAVAAMPTFVGAGLSAESLQAKVQSEQLARGGGVASARISGPRTQVIDNSPEYTEQWAPQTFISNAFENANDPSEVIINQSYAWYTTSGSSYGNTAPDQTPHNVEMIPDDWGLELDYNLYNDIIPGGGPDVHPNCPAGTDDHFWGARGTDGGEVRSWDLYVGGSTTESAEDWGAYFDGNDASDDCSRLGLSIGIGYPKNLNDGLTTNTPQRLSLYTTVITDRGDEDMSVQSANYSLVGNECDLAFQRPRSACMGLNLTRDYPGPGSQSSITVGKSNGYTAPGVLYFYSGWDGALDYAPFG